MNIEELKDLIEGTLLELLYESEEVQDLVVEIVKRNPEMLAESIGTKNIPKEPENAELYDNLLLIAQGKVPKLNHEGKVVSAPNYGVGFKSGKKIKEWTNKAYSKLGGKWGTVAQLNGKTGVNDDTISFLSLIGDGESAGGGAAIRAAAQMGNDKILREQIIGAGNRTMMMLNENGDFDAEKEMDISDLLMDTAKTTLKNFPTSHREGNQGTHPADAAAAVVAESTPEELFGESANSWAHVAFDGMNLND
jgi:hypothetical protein